MGIRWTKLWTFLEASYSISIIYFFVLSHSTWPSQFLVSYYFSTLRSHLLTVFIVLTRPFSSLSQFLPFSLYLLGLSWSTHRLALLKNKKNSSFTSLFPLRSTEISRKWKHSEKYNKTDQWKFLVIFPKRSTEISSLSKF